VLVQLPASDEAIDEMLSATFGMLDANGDGKLSAAELATGIGVFAGGSQHEKITAMFRLFDTDGDGYVSRPEMVVMLGAMFRALAARDGFTMPEEQ
jgi:Ca2+-binding EF-hand superfamily protein